VGQKLDIPPVLLQNKSMTTALALLAFFVLSIMTTAGGKCFAQTQIVTLAAGSGQPASCVLTTNQIIQIISVTGQSPSFSEVTVNGVTFITNNPAPLLPLIYLFHSSGLTISSQTLGTYTGLTNIMVTPSEAITNGQTISISFNPGLVTLSITTPPESLVISNYVPADAIVIPASTTGNVQIILESSSDLVNWTAANAGTYGPSSATNRFFRVRAAVGP